MPSAHPESPPGRADPGLVYIFSENGDLALTFHLPDLVKCLADIFNNVIDILDTD
jgi:hypothetical protein